MKTGYLFYLTPWTAMYSPGRPWWFVRVFLRAMFGWRWLPDRRTTKCEACIIIGEVNQPEYQWSRCAGHPIEWLGKGREDAPSKQDQV